jgi:hypothetical protein
MHIVERDLLSESIGLIIDEKQKKVLLVVSTRSW